MIKDRFRLCLFGPDDGWCDDSRRDVRSAGSPAGRDGANGGVVGERLHRAYLANGWLARRSTVGGSGTRVAIVEVARGDRSPIDGDGDGPTGDDGGRVHDDDDDGDAGLWCSNRWANRRQ